MTTVVRVDTRGLDRLMGRVKKIPNSLGKVGYDWCKVAAKDLRMQAMSSSRATPSRGKATQQIMARKKGKRRAEVVMPRKLMLLDSMKPHYVALKRGRAITDWARKYYGSKVVSAKSRVFKGPRGGIQHTPGRKSALFVTPDPFINKALMRAEKKLPRMLRGAIRRTLQGGA